MRSTPRLRLAGLLVLLLAAPACARTDPAPAPPAAVPAETARDGAAERLVLAFQAQAATADGGLQLRFLGYRDDRCPPDVQCVWAGDAEALLRASGPGLPP